MKFLYEARVLSYINETRCNSEGGKNLISLFTKDACYPEKK
jgi:hypothetical protein